jgi:signal transduction histidine kinase
VRKGNRQRFGPLSIRATVVAGFGLTLGVWLFASYDFSGRIAEIKSRAEGAEDRYQNAQLLLSGIRDQMTLASVSVRDALLDPDHALADYQRQVEEGFDATKQALASYVPLSDDPADRDQLARLRGEIDDFRQTLLEVLATDSSLWPTQGGSLIRFSIEPRRARLSRTTEQLQRLNRNAFLKQQSSEIDAIYAVSQTRFRRSLAAALLISLGIALFAVVRAGGLEKRLEHQLKLEERSARELQQLSAKLVMAQEDERRSIARELHDEIGQALTAIKVELSVAQRAVEAQGAGTGILEDARSITDGAIATVRDLSQLLHPAMLDDLGLPAAVEWYLQGFGRRYSIQTEVSHHNLDTRLAPEVEASIYRIIQEGVTNVGKHAQAKTCRVALECRADAVLITIEDDGVGFDQASQAPGTGLGLIGIRERAVQLRGVVHIDSVPGRGTRLTVELPARPRALAAGDPAPDGLPGGTPQTALND